MKVFVWKSNDEWVRECDVMNWKMGEGICYCNELVLEEWGCGSCCKKIEEKEGNGVIEWGLYGLVGKWNDRYEG
jgi:hypothetical protein|tara:strand:+ start:53 stop:274 length:222 start_codon:yes stop_codon:yes gene_type:complete